MVAGAFIRRLGERLNRWSERLVPDPFIFALLLSAVAALLGLVFFQAPGEGGVTAGDVGLLGRLDAVLSGWSTEFFELKKLRFALQMCLVLVTGHALALSAPVQRLVLRIAHLPRNTAQAAALVALVAEIAGIVHWGLGAVVGAFLAREIARIASREGRPIHYPILGAAAYMGLLVWHGGLSGSAPLVVANPEHFLVDMIGVVGTSETLFSPLNLIVTGSVSALVPLVFWLLTPADESRFVSFEGAVGRAEPAEAAESEARWAGVAGALENSLVVGLVTGAIGLGWTLFRLFSGRAAFDLDAVNFIFLFAGILAQGTPIRYVRAIGDGARGCGGILLQFPFYFGILGILTGSGLIDWFADGLAALANEKTLPVLSFVSAGVVNMFVPSGGGQWAVQGELLMAAAQRVGADINHTIMAFAYGDALTNMLQPFWALPLLGITGLKARQIIGYTGAVMILVAPVIALLLFLFA